MKRETLLTFVVTSLLLLNLGTLGFLFWGRPPLPAGKGPRALDRMIVEKLSLNEAQRETFRQLKKAHHEQMLISEEAYRQALGQYFSLLDQPVEVPKQQDSLLAIVSNIQQERAQFTYQHFKDLKAICSPEQQKGFHDLLPDLLQVISPRH